MDDMVLCSMAYTTTTSSCPSTTTNVNTEQTRKCNLQPGPANLQLVERAWHHTMH